MGRRSSFAGRPTIGSCPHPDMIVTSNSFTTVRPAWVFVGRRPRRRHERFGTRSVSGLPFHGSRGGPPREGRSEAKKRRRATKAGGLRRPWDVSPARPSHARAAAVCLTTSQQQTQWDTWYPGGTHAFHEAAEPAGRRSRFRFPGARCPRGKGERHAKRPDSVHGDHRTPPRRHQRDASRRRVPCPAHHLHGRDPAHQRGGRGHAPRGGEARSVPRSRGRGRDLDTARPERVAQRAGDGNGVPRLGAATGPGEPRLCAMSSCAATARCRTARCVPSSSS